MKTFFKDVLDELDKRFTGTVTLESVEEREILKEILTEFEAGKLGKQFKKTQRRLARKKPIIEKEKEDNPLDYIKKYYSDVDLHLHSDDALQLIEKGFKKGATYNAPGNAGGAFNETLSNEGVILLDKFNITMEQLALVLYYRTLNTVLGKQQKDYPRNGIDIPNEVPRVHQDLYVASFLAARSAFEKHYRSTIGTMALVEKHQFKLVKREAFGGSVGDLNELRDRIISADNCYIYDVDMDKVVRVPRLQLMNWALAAGGKENSGDTVVLVTDSAGNILYDGWSDKKSLADIQSNGTLNEDFTKIINRINEFNENKLLDSNTSEKVIELVREYQTKINEIEEGYKNAAIGEANYFLSISPKFKEIVAIWMDMQESFYKKNKTSNHVENSKMADGFTGSDNLHYLDYLMEHGVHKSATRCKVINRIAIMERLWYARNKKVIPFTLDTQGIVSLAREEVMSKHSEVLSKLNEYTIPYYDAIVPLGDALSFYDTVEMLQISKIEEPKNDTDYVQFLKRNTNLIMGGIAITPTLIKKSLGIENLKHFIGRHKFISEERIVYDNKDMYVTGKVIQLCACDKLGNIKRIGQKSYRSKQGFSGKTSNTIQWSMEIQKSFKENR